MKPEDLFKQMRPNLTTAQVQATYKLMEQGARLETLAEFAGLQPVAPLAPTKGPFKLSARSIERLSGVNDDLVRVVKRAIELTPIDFMVLEGLRTKDQAWINWGKGRTVAQLAAQGVPAKYAAPHLAKVTWLANPLNSKHIIGRAVDLVPYPVDWNDLKKFDQIAAAMFAAAGELGVKIRWGADWDGDGNYREKGESDSPHFEV